MFSKKTILDSVNTVGGDGFHEHRDFILLHIVSIYTYYPCRKIESPPNWRSKSFGHSSRVFFSLTHHDFADPVTRYLAYSRQRVSCYNHEKSHGVAGSFAVDGNV
jgi:hypothetical protein